MTAIVLNTATGAVTEYDWTFQSITPLRAASAAGLFALGGNDDAGAPIPGELRTGRPAGGKPMMIGEVFLAIFGEGDGTLIVEGRDDSWEYPLPLRANGLARAKPGRGIRQTSLGLGFRNVNGAAFRIEQIDADISETSTRRN